MHASIQAVPSPTRATGSDGEEEEGSGARLVKTGCHMGCRHTIFRQARAAPGKRYVDHGNNGKRMGDGDARGRRRVSVGHGRVQRLVCRTSTDRLVLFAGAVVIHGDSHVEVHPCGRLRDDDNRGGEGGLFRAAGRIPWRGPKGIGRLANAAVKDSRHAGGPERQRGDVRTALPAWPSRVPRFCVVSGQRRSVGARCGP